MLKSFFLILFGVLALSPLVIPVHESFATFIPTPLPPNTGEAALTTEMPGTTTPTALIPTNPALVSIPSIALNDKIITVGVNTKGEMDVPAGNTKEVGWYGSGTIPGTVGSAVLDAHVFAAFAKLKNIKIGSDIYVKTDSGQQLHFEVSEIQTYALQDIPTDLLFNRADTERLNLITCAGKLTADHSTYDHRLVIYATLVHDNNSNS